MSGGLADSAVKFIQVPDQDLRGRLIRGERHIVDIAYLEERSDIGFVGVGRQGIP